MAANVIKNYKMGENDFLHFANTMNKNAELDLKKVSPNTTAGSNAVTSAIEPTAAPETIPGVEEATDHIPDTSNNTDTETGNNSAAATETNQATGNLLSEEEWYAKNGLDPDADYQNTVNTLNYEYQTSMATYGETAEKLYQMGLSNSGVSDVYGANAFSAYISAINSANQSRINAKRSNKQMYNQYVNEHNANTEKSISEAFNSFADQYTADREGTIRQALLAQGMDETAVNAAITKMQEYQQSLPENERALSRTDQAVNEIYAEYVESYNPSMRENIKLILENSNKYSDAEITAALDKLDGLNSNVLKNETKKYLDENLKLRDASLQTAYDLISETTDPETKEAIQEKSADMIYKAVENVQSLQEAYNLVGIEQSRWDAMNDSDKIKTILDVAGRYAKKGVLSEDGYVAIVREWIINEVDMGTPGRPIKDQLTRYYNQGYFSKERYDDLYYQVKKSIADYLDR